MMGSDFQILALLTQDVALPAIQLPNKDPGSTAQT